MALIDIRQLLSLLQKIKIQYRRGTAADWIAKNPVLAEGEPGYETDTKLVKIGDGISTWNQLEYSTGGSDGEVAVPDLTLLYENAKV